MEVYTSSTGCTSLVEGFEHDHNKQEAVPGSSGEVVDLEVAGVCVPSVRMDVVLYTLEVHTATCAAVFVKEHGRFVRGYPECKFGRPIPRGSGESSQGLA